MIREPQHLRVRDRESTVVHLAEHEAGEGTAGIPAVVTRNGRASTVERKAACGGIAVVRVQEHQLVGVTEFEAVVALHPGQAFVEAVDGVVLIPQLGAVPAVVVVIRERDLREAGVVARIVSDRAAQFVTPVLAERLYGDVMLGMREPVRADGELLMTVGLNRWVSFSRKTLP